MLISAFSLLLAQMFLDDKIIKNVKSLLVSSNSTNCLHRFVNYKENAMRDVFVHNPDFWAKGIDFSCVSPWNNIHGSQRGGTLISKRHIVYSTNFPLSTGARIVFVDSQGNICPCYLEKSHAIANTDITVGLLNVEITSGITPAKLLPDDFEKYFKYKGYRMPIGTFNQEEMLLLTEARELISNKKNK